MTSRTFALSRHRRRRTHAQPPLVPSQDDVAMAQPAAPDPLGDELERAPGMQRDDAGRPLDPATHSAGARPPAPRLPHEHDEYADAPAAPRQPIIQAERDVASGQVDTDLRGKAAEVFDRTHDRRRRR
jgi:hypothetical protein